MQWKENWNKLIKSHQSREASQGKPGEVRGNQADSESQARGSQGKPGQGKPGKRQGKPGKVRGTPGKASGTMIEISHALYLI